jgi:two-component system NtrC family sensor kinase
VLLIHVLQGPDRGRKYELPAHEPQLIGRSSEALPITDSTVSRRHAELTPDDGKWYLRDLDSANGTFVNGIRITDRVVLAPGDQIRCGSTLLVFAVAPDNRRTSTIAYMAPEDFDVTVEGTVDSNSDSMILASPDPARAAIEHLRIIYDLTALTGATFDRDELLGRVMELIFVEFQPDRGFILLRSNPNSTTENTESTEKAFRNESSVNSVVSIQSRLDPVVVRYKIKPKTLDEGRIPVSRTIVQHTLEKGEGILSTNAMNDQRFRSGDSVRDYGIRSAICVPIKAGERIFGVIHIDSSLANFTFTEQQLQLMNAIGQHTGLALQSAEVVGLKVHTERLAAMGETVASLSHSIKNILQGLRGGADAVELALNRGDFQMAKEGWPILARNLDRIFALTQNMLAYSKQRPLEIDLINLHELIREVCELIQPQAQRKRAGLIMDLAEHMPPVPADASALHQALMNVLTNAVEAVPSKTGIITITTQYCDAEHEARIIVADNGPGMPAELQRNAFEAFTSTKGQRGTGLGLTVTRKLVQDHGGRIMLESNPGKGAMVTIVIPTDRMPGIDPSDTRLPRPMAQVEDEQFEE